MVNDDVLQHIDVESYLKRTCSYWRHLAEHNVFGDTMAIAFLANCSCFPTVSSNEHRIEHLYPFC
jgi:hypothetical protein